MGEDEEEEDLGEESESEWSPMATAAAATDLGRAGDPNPIKPSATRRRGAASQVECLVRWRRWVVGQPASPGVPDA